MLVHFYHIPRNLGGTMIMGLGIDVVELQRISRLLERYGAAFLHKILTPEERQHVPTQAVPFVAARFAAKEAAVKALGTGFRQGIGFQHIAVHSGPLGQPELTLCGPAAARMAQLGAIRTHLSLTHGRDTAAAVVILET